MAGRLLSRERFQVPRQVSPSQRDSRSRSRPRDRARVPPREPSRQPVQVFAEDQPGPTLRTRPGTSESPTSIAQPGQGQDLFDTAQMTELLQRNPNINAPILRQLVEELQRVRDEPQHAETEVPQPPQTTDYNVLLHGNPMWNEPFIRPPTTLERIIALARRSNPEQAMRRADDHETQLASLPPQDRQVLLLLQRLTIASNPTTLFDTRHLSAHDFLHVDAFLRSDLHRTIRSYFTKEIFIPNWELNQDTTYPQVALYEIAHNLQGVQQLSQQLVDYTAQLSHQQQMPAEPALLFEQIVQLHRFIDNINERHVALLTHFQNTHFRQDDPPPYLADLLAYYNIHFADFQATSATATAAIAEARRVLDDLVRLHREQMRTTLDTVQAVRDVAQPLRAPPAMQATQPPQTLPATRPRRDPTPSRPQAPPLVRRPPSRSPTSPVAPSSRSLHVPRARRLRLSRRNFPPPRGFRLSRRTTVRQAPRHTRNRSTLTQLGRHIDRAAARESRKCRQRIRIACPGNQQKFPNAHAVSSARSCISHRVAPMLQA
ncbi:hypothetical protein GCK32_017862 [Trichostrongylus colubriformis]|uniref:Uncharacterized protein n=1 Tax=Trichostrongylus colubriformis TaxID=6319 RepID=A0AAN8EU91_TRICO